jgi:hypothetical protein
MSATREAGPRLLIATELFGDESTTTTSYREYCGVVFNSESKCWAKGLKVKSLSDGVHTATPTKRRRRINECELQLAFNKTPAHNL